MTHQPVDLGTLAGILETERKIRSILGDDAYKTRKTMSDRLLDLKKSEEEEFCTVVNALKDHCRYLSACTVVPEEAREGR